VNTDGLVKNPLRLVGADEGSEMYENVNGYYDQGFAVSVDAVGDVKVESAHFSEYVFKYSPFLPGERSVKGMKKAVERAKKRLQKQEDKLLAIKEAFNG
jgi:hypothetical protein